MIRMDQLRGTETILVVDDDEDARQAMSRTLEYHGYTALQATSGEDALEILDRRGDGVDLALIDIVMPGMTGLSLGRTIEDRHPETLMLFTSGYVDEGLPDSARTEGRVHFLKKPMTIRQLSLKIRKVLDRGSVQPSGSEVRGR